MGGKSVFKHKLESKDERTASTARLSIPDGMGRRRQLEALEPPGHASPLLNSLKVSDRAHSLTPLPWTVHPVPALLSLSLSPPLLCSNT